MILLDLKDSRPIYEQVVERFQELMMMGILEEDSQMPSVRSLAMELSINPNTIQRAYGELERRGYTYSVKGRGSFVGSIRKLREAKKTEMEGKLEKLAREARTIGILREEFVMMSGEAYDSRAGDGGQGAERAPTQPAEGKRTQPIEGEPEQPAEEKPMKSTEGESEQPTEGKRTQPTERESEQPAEGRLVQSTEEMSDEKLWSGMNREG